MVILDTYSGDVLMLRAEDEGLGDRYDRGGPGGRVQQQHAPTCLQHPAGH